MRWIILRLIKVSLFIYLSFMLIIWFYWLKDVWTWLKTKAVFAVIYWWDITLDGEPSWSLQAKLDKTIMLIKWQKAEKIIVTWWYWLSWFNEWEIMKDYLVSNGIAEENIIVDSVWTNTIDSSKHIFSINTADWHYPNVWIIWVWEFYHLARMRLSLQKVWFVNIWTVNSGYFEYKDIFLLAREVTMYAKYLFMWVELSANYSISDLKVIWEKVVDLVVEED